MESGELPSAVVISATTGRNRARRLSTDGRHWDSFGNLITYAYSTESPCREPGSRGIPSPGSPQAGTCHCGSDGGRNADLVRFLVGDIIFRTASVGQSAKRHRSAQPGVFESSGKQDPAGRDPTKDCCPPTTGGEPVLERERHECFTESDRGKRSTHSFVCETGLCFRSRNQSRHEWHERH